jgi:hypothetical protein
VIRVPSRGGERVYGLRRSVEHEEFSMKPVTVLFLLLAAFLLPAASLASAAAVEWDQERVAALARDLIEPIEALRADLESRPPVPGKEEARAVVVNDVERLHSRARELVQRLASGAGQADTVTLFREFEALQSQAAKHTREYPAPFDMSVHIGRLQTTTSELARYYGESTGAPR